MNGFGLGLNVKRLAALAVVAVAIFSLAQAGSSHASGGTLEWWPDDSSVETFGPNEAVTIDIGTINFSCDTFFPTADVYVVKGVPAVGDKLVDVSGTPNTVFGASDGFFSDTIAYTEPSGTLGSGTYSVVYDECQDGILSSNDEVFPNAFSVDIPTNVPPLDPAIAEIKSSAKEMAEHWESALGGFKTLEELEQAEVYLECLDALTEPETFLAECSSAYVQEKLINANGALEQLQEKTEDVLEDDIKHYDGIVADPPDPNYQQPAVLPAVNRPDDPQSTDPIVNAQANVVSAAATESATTSALLDAMQRYEGAAAAGNGEWALAHARELRGLAAQSKDQLAAVKDSLTQLATTVSSDPRDLDSLAGKEEAIAEQVVSSGFTTQQRELLANLGVNPNTLAALAAQAADNVGVGSFTKSGFASLLDGLVTAITDEQTALDGLATGANGLISALMSDPNVLDRIPTANAGGSYAVNEGQTIQLNGSATVPFGQLASASWDLNGDGVFDDATGLTPTVSFPKSFDGMIGLRVTDTFGRSSVAYANVSIADSNKAPVIGSSSPANPAAMTFGSTQTFTVSASDPEGRPVSINWQLDGTGVGSGPSFDYSPPVGDVGAHDLQARVSDGASTVTRTWLVDVTYPDADGDGWAANVDCNATGSQVVRLLDDRHVKTRFGQPIRRCRAGDSCAGDQCRLHGSSVSASSVKLQ